MEEPTLAPNGAKYCPSLYRSDQPVFEFSLCAGTNAIRKPVIPPEPCQSDSLREGSEENAGSHWANSVPQPLSTCLFSQGRCTGHRGLTLQTAASRHLQALCSLSISLRWPALPPQTLHSPSCLFWSGRN